MTIAKNIQLVRIITLKRRIVLKTSSISFSEFLSNNFLIIATTTKKIKLKTATTTQKKSMFVSIFENQN